MNFFEDAYSILFNFFFKESGNFYAIFSEDLFLFPDLTFFLTITDPGVLADPLTIPLLTTVILLSSGLVITFSHNSLRNRDYFNSLLSLVITIFLGLLFFFFQIYEYTSSSFSINDGVYGTVFYMLTGFHGFHVLIGTIFLIVCLLRFVFQHFTPGNHFGFEAAIWY
jgi:heme/copper-type cytochrome/quinol oxidase subunit 3